MSKRNRRGSRRTRSKAQWQRQNQGSTHRHMFVKSTDAEYRAYRRAMRKLRDLAKGIKQQLDVFSAETKMRREHVYS